MTDRFDDIRSYNDSELNAAMLRIIENDNFNVIAERYFPGVPIDNLKNTIAGFHDIDTMQKIIMHPIIRGIAHTSTTSFTWSGIEKLDPAKPYLFVSNHRDIILDAALLQLVLFENRFPTTEITFGSNLMINRFIIDIGKSNRMFKVERGGSRIDMYHHSSHLSDYIRYCIKNNRSVWIAQRNGRTKNGFDKTEAGVLRMFGMSGDKDFVKNYEELNIVPISISFEYEPCDYMKTNELYQREVNGSYTKTDDEDFRSILIGVNSNKGGVHISINDVISREDLQAIVETGTKSPVNELANLMDKRINSNYKLRKTNYMAFDLLKNSAKFAYKYTPEERATFLQFTDTQLANIKGNHARLREIFLTIYANPVINSCLDAIQTEI